MTPHAKSRLVLGGTLLLGALLGAALVGAMGQWRADRVAGMRRPGGFVRHMEDIIRPNDAEQRRAVLPILRETERSNEEILRASGDQMRDALDAMIEQLAPLLDADQLQRLQDFALSPPPGEGRPGGDGRRPPLQRKKRRR